MKAIVHTQYGPPELLQLKEVPTPEPADDEVRVRILATTVTTSDCNVRNFTFVPKAFLLPTRMQIGYKQPKKNILGMDLAGTIDAVGKDVSRFSVGDEVFGTLDQAFGAHAEYACMPGSGFLTTRPANATWEEAAAIPLAGNTALYFVRDLGAVQSGEKVLVNGASGGIGTFAVQLAKYYGAHVTGVCSGANVELVRSLGADQVIDYTRDDFTRSPETYDAIFDAVSKLTYGQCRGSLKESGRFLATLPTLAIMFQAAWTSIGRGPKVKFGDAVPKLENLVFLKELVEAGKLKPVVDRTYPLERTAEAFRYVEAGHKKGNVVITVASNGG
jgi:NADPH:quinone reductase-like Zn-dependent oxidoreductase